MGGLCSKSANESDNFQTPGRVLGSAPSGGINSSTPVPSGISTSSPGRKLGGGGGGGGGGGQSTPSSEDPRSAAAKAAEERASKTNKAGGRLQGQLAAQKKQTQNQLLQASSDQERGARIADANTEARNWN